MRGMTSADNQEWVNAGLTATKNALANTYYKKTLQVLYMLLLSGISPHERFRLRLRVK